MVVCFQLAETANGGFCYPHLTSVRLFVAVLDYGYVTRNHCCFYDEYERERYCSHG